jgi:DNA modification methylase
MGTVEINKIYNEDCFITMSNMEDNLVDIVMTSPPYNMTARKGGYSDSGRYDVYEDWMTESEYIDFTIRLFNNFDRVVKENGVVLYNFSYSIENPSLPYKLVAEIVDKTEWCIADTIMWKKGSGLPFPANERRLSRNWEFVWVFVRKNEIDTFKCNKGVKSISEKTGQKYYNVFYNYIEAKNNDGKTHGLNQATYSTDLCTKLFDIYADDGYVVYDPFMGTGTTANACVLNGLNYIGSELSTKQCEYAENRINESKNNLFSL